MEDVKNDFSTIRTFFPKPPATFLSQKKTFFQQHSRYFFYKNTLYCEYYSLNYKKIFHVGNKQIKFKARGKITLENTETPIIHQINFHSQER